MKLASVRAADALGTVLAHSLRANGKLIKKGHTITTEDLALLSSAGIESVFVGKFDHDDVPEDEAAARIASRFAAMQNLYVAPPATGRVYIYASKPGLFIADSSLVNRLNRIDPAITIACLANSVPVPKNKMVATIKIIPFAVERRSVEQVTYLLSAGKPFDVKPFSPKRVALIATVLPGLKDQVMEKTRRVLESRLQLSGSTVVTEWRVAHDKGALATAVTAACEEHDLIVIFGASAVSAMDDIVPTAIVQAGGQIEHIGMPVDPGNLLLLARSQNVPILGAPGCARSPKLSGMDIILDRILAGEWPSPMDINGLGVGGLLMDNSGHNHPNRSEYDM